MRRQPLATTRQIFQNAVMDSSQGSDANARAQKQDSPGSSECLEEQYKPVSEEF